MKSRNEKIIEMANELQSINDYEAFENILDEMTLSFVQTETSETLKGDAYWMVINLKKFLKTACDNPVKVF